MGMFDELQCNYDIGEYTGLFFQTKSFYRHLDVYIITGDEKLLLMRRDPDEGDNPPDDWDPAIDFKYHGEIIFWNIFDGRMLEFKAIFKWGKLKSIEKIVDRPFGEFQKENKKKFEELKNEE